MIDHTYFQIFAFFATTEKGIILHDTYNKPDNAEALIGIAIPLHYFVKVYTRSEECPNQSRIADDHHRKRIPMQEYKMILY